jgi:hypothetical protein
MTARTLLVFVLSLKPHSESDFIAAMIGGVKAVSASVKPYETSCVVPNTRFGKEPAPLQPGWCWFQSSGHAATAGIDGERTIDPQ